MKFNIAGILLLCFPSPCINVFQGQLLYRSWQTEQLQYPSQSLEIRTLQTLFLNLFKLVLHGYHIHCSFWSCCSLPNLAGSRRRFLKYYFPLNVHSLQLPDGCHCLWKKDGFPLWVIIKQRATWKLLLDLLETSVWGQPYCFWLILLYEQDKVPDFSYPSYCLNGLLMIQVFVFKFLRF